MFQIMDKRRLVTEGAVQQSKDEATIQVFSFVDLILLLLLFLLLLIMMYITCLYLPVAVSINLSVISLV